MPERPTYAESVDGADVTRAQERPYCEDETLALAAPAGRCVAAALYSCSNFGSRGKGQPPSAEPWRSIGSPGILVRCYNEA
jgi:hypothetical protein